MSSTQTPFFKKSWMLLRCHTAASCVSQGPLDLTTSCPGEESTQDTSKHFTALHLHSKVGVMTEILRQTFWANLRLSTQIFRADSRTEIILLGQLTCFMAVSPILSECFRILSKKSLRSDMDISFISSRSFGRFSIIIWQKRYWLTLGRYRFSSCSIVFKAE